LGSAKVVTLECVLFQRDPVGGWNQALGRQHAGSWTAGNSFGADKFGNRLTIVLSHDPPALSRTSGRAVILEFAACLVAACDGM